MSTTITRLAAIAVIATAFAAPAGAQSLSEAEKQKMLANMLEADGNDDGVLNRGEFETLVRLNADDKLGRAALVVRAGAYDKAFERLDGNSDGILTKDEARKLADSRD